MTMRRRLLLGAVMLAAAGTAASTLHAAPGPAQVKIDNFTFSPAVLQVEKGTEVTWTNHDDIPHTVVLTSINKRSKTIDTDGTFSFTFDKPGTYAYICGLHPHMKGQIVVK